MESGTTAEFHSSVLFDSPNRLEIYGDQGYALCDGTLGRQGKGTINMNGKPMEFQPVNPYEGEIRDFISSILDNRSPEVDGMEGLRNVELLERINTESVD
jgi:predicted dehydrogenase